MDFSGVNVGELLVASAATVLIGFLWYSDKLFGRNSRAKRAKETKNGWLAVWVVPTIIMFLLGLIIALFVSVLAEIAMTLGTQAWYAGLLSALTCLGLVCTSFGIIYLHEGRTVRAYLVDAGYLLVNFFVVGLIIGAWY